MRATGPGWRQSPAWPASPTKRSFIVLTACITTIGIAGYLVQHTSPPPRVDFRIQQSAEPSPHALDAPAGDGHDPVLGETVETVARPCVGPHGTPILDGHEDQIRPQQLEIPYPTPFSGSFEALGLPREWMTYAGRYGPYGLATSGAATDWSRVDWGQLQSDCQAQNAARFPEAGRAPFNAADVRFRLRPDSSNQDPFYHRWLAALRSRLGLGKTKTYNLSRTNRTAVVLRTYDGYLYTEEDLVNTRALISEAALQSGGEYTVVLLVNVREADKDIWASPVKYQAALDAANIPEEFKHLVVLWDESLLQSWYPQVPDHSIFLQISQAMQLFALFYPEFDSYWQLEMDMRSLGHTLTLLRALDAFGRGEPRKQSWERASYRYFHDSYGSWANFTAAVDAALHGGASVWGAHRIPEIPHPVGPRPPVADARGDAFEWGVGEDADLIVTNPCIWVPRMQAWPFRGWMRGPFAQGLATPRLTCPPAVQRASRRLLLAAHEAQVQRGLAVPSEATLASFALWHGLKISAPPLPVFRGEPIHARLKEVFWNGGRPGECLNLADGPVDANADVVDTVPMTDPDPRPYYRGFACGEGRVNWEKRAALTGSLTWWWEGDLSRRIIDDWRDGTLPTPGNNSTTGTEKADMRTAMVLAREQGRVWAPAGWLHPVKTNQNPGT